MNTVNIAYNGMLLASLTEGQTARIICGQRTLKTDIVITFGIAGNVTFNGKTTTVKAGQTATISGRKMKTNVVVQAFSEGGAILQNKTVTITKNGIKEITADAGYDGLSKATVNVDVPIPEAPEVTAEEIAVTPTKATQEITPSNADYLSKVTVNPIPSSYIQPSGDLKITENGTYPVTEKASVTVNVAGGGSSECSGNHIIEVEELPTENIDTTVLYECGEQYHQYVEGTFRDIIMSYNGGGDSLLAEFPGAELYQVKTKPTENIVESDPNNEFWAVYYVEDENDIFIYGDMDGNGTVWFSLSEMFGGYYTFQGTISDISEITTAGYYALGGAHWNHYNIVSGSLTITENSTADVTDKVSVIVDVKPKLQYKSASANGTIRADTGYDGLSSVYVNVPIPDGYIQPSGTLEITENGTHDVTNYASAEVNVSIPTVYVVRSAKSLQSELVNGSIAIILGGE